jgi:hypothetical protein
VTRGQSRLPNPCSKSQAGPSKTFGEAEIWILDRQSQAPFAFVTICEALAIQPDHLGDGIRTWRMQLSNGADSRRLQRRSVRRSEPIGSLARRRSNHSGPPLGDLSQAASDA